MDIKSASKSKQRIGSLSKEVTYHLSRILKAKDLTKGTVCTQKKRCGNPNCKCARGELHQAQVLSSSWQGKTLLIPLTKFSIVELMDIERHVKNYQKFRLNRARVVYLLKELVLELNKLEQNLLIEVKSKKGGFNAKRKKQR